MVAIRPGRPSDGDVLREIQARTLAEPWPELLETALTGFPPLYVAADARNEPLGYAIVVPGSDVIAYLPELAVDPSEQRRGYGSALLDAVCAALRDAGRTELRLTVRVVDEGAREFYRANGFETHERLPDHFLNCDGLVLSRELSRA